jgi:uncharacterized protein DUF6791/ThiF family protein
MLQTLVSHNDDIRRLVERGFAVGFDSDSNCLIIRDVPYLDDALGLQTGGIVAKLDFVDQYRVRQTDHQVYFAGSTPFGADGAPIPNLGGGPHTLLLGDAAADVVVERSFSNKPVSTGRFEDLHHKIESYVTIISGPAMELHGANPYTFRLVEEDESESVFKFRDTLSSRAEITDLSRRMKDDLVAIIGLGGTGAYVLDYLVKTPIRELRAFDNDRYYVHNAFRSPGRLEETDLGRPKAEVYEGRYDNFRDGLHIISTLIDTHTANVLDGITFAFVCVDKGSARAGIFDALIERAIPFIDVGMGLNRKAGPLDGMMRLTYYPSESAATRRAMHLAPLDDGPDDEYRNNVQTSELNALNAALAVLKFKQLRGFYVDRGAPEHMLFRVGDLETASDERDATV